MSDVWNPEDKKGEEPFEGKFDTWKDVFDYYIKDENLLETHRAKGGSNRGLHGPANVKGGDYYLVDFPNFDAGSKNLCYVKKNYRSVEDIYDNIYFLPIQEYIVAWDGRDRWDMSINRVVDGGHSRWTTGSNVGWNELHTKFYKIDMFEPFDLFMNWINENPFEVKE